MCYWEVVWEAVSATSLPSLEKDVCPLTIKVGFSVTSSAVISIRRFGDLSAVEISHSDRPIFRCTNKVTSIFLKTLSLLYAITIDVRAPHLHAFCCIGLSTRAVGDKHLAYGRSSMSVNKDHGLYPLIRFLEHRDNEDPSVVSTHDVGRVLAGGVNGWLSHLFIRVEELELIFIIEALYQQRLEVNKGSMLLIRVVWRE